MNRNKKAELTRIHKLFFDAGTGQKQSQPLAKFVDENIYGFGTAVDEKVLGINEFKKLLNNQKKQTKGMNLKWKVKPLHCFISEDENNAVFSDELYLSVVAGGEHINKCFRFSVVLNYINNHWKVIHWHGSAPEQLESDKDTFGINEWKQKTIELEKIVAQRTSELTEKNRELEIESALEKVRSKAMAMRSSNELKEVAREMRIQFALLGQKELETCAIHLWDKELGKMEAWAAIRSLDNTGEIIESESNFTIKGIRILEESFRKYLGGKKDYVLINDVARAKEFFKALKKIDPKAADFLAYSIKNKKPDDVSAYWSVSDFSGGSLVMVTQNRPDENSRALLSRFANVFGLAYGRFKDLQKAEAQAREAEIQLALERVRAKSLAMHQSDELAEVVKLLYQEFDKLKVNNESTDIEIGLIDEGTGIASVWAHSYLSDGTIKTFNFPIARFLATIDEYKKWKSTKVEKRSDLFFTTDLSGNKWKKIIDWAGKSPEMKGINLSTLKSNISRWVTHNAYFSHGIITLQGTQPYSLATQEILKRFAKVFEQAYTRFLDLQKAEAQAREAQIEAALEKVRSRAMAMQQPGELIQVAELLRKEMGKVGVEELETSSVYIVNNESTECWYAIKDVREKDTHFVSDHMTIVLNDTWVGKEMQKFYNSSQQKISIVMKGEIRKEWINYCAGKSTVLKGYYGNEIPERTYHLIKFAGGFMGAASPGEISKESHDLLQRATNVFSLAYTRFKDLQDAAARTRETEIELALERVRSRSMAMHKSDELKEVIRLVLEQFVHLNIKAEHAGFYIDYKAQDDMHIWLADPNLEPFFAVLPYFDSPTWNSFREAKAKGIPLHTDLLDFKEKNKFYKSLFKLFTVPEEAKQFYMKCKGLAVSTVLLDSVGLYIENFSAIPYTDEENTILMRFGKVFQQTYTRFLDLQKAEAQTRESQIQLALERVRARTMAMQKSEELADAASLLFQQVKSLGIESFSSGFTVWENNDNDLVSWMCNADGSVNPPFRMPASDIEWHRQQYESWKKKEDFIIHDFNGKEMQSHYAYLRSFSLLDEAFKKSEAAGVPIPERQVHNAFNFTQGNLLFITLQPVPESYDIFKRFAKTFEQTYTRFLDLQKAEAQAREAMIEAGLERVRSHGMAMQSSEELNALIGTVFTELTKLDLVLTRCIIWVFEPDTNAARWWMANIEEPSNPMSFFIKYHEHPAYLAFVKEWKNQNTKFVYDLKGQDKITWDEFFFTETELKNLPEVVKNGMRAPERILLSSSFNNFGGINVASLEPLSDEHFDIMLRFAKVFDLTYTRFLDLKNAEAQAREAQIQLTLERVRARTMAMQKSEELQEAASLMFQQLQSLGIPSWSCGYNIFQKDDNVATSWVSNHGQIQPPFNIPLTELSTFIHFKTSKENGEDFWIEELEGEELKMHYNYLLSLPGIEAISEQNNKNKLSLPLYQINHVVNFSQGNLIFITYEKVPEAHDIFKRFGKVFEQTYTRFLDLQKAEAQTRESQIQLALERVRARTMAMHVSDELTQTADIMFEQVKQLGAELQGVAFAICNKNSMMVQKWTSIGIFSHPYNIEPGEQRMYEAWKNGEELYEEVYEGEKQKKYYEAFMEIPEFRQGIQKFIDSGFPIPTWQKNHAVPFKYGYLLFITTKPFTETDIFIRFGKVFEQTYTRFLDLQKAEEQTIKAEKSLIEIKAARKNAEDALTELQATQKQLIQSEKMASLGELTAGIAHEIQNPLNFVNNFSEVSTELVDEMNKEISNGNLDDAKEIANDLKQNLEKINHHGKRAGDIVKGMLQHSRKSEGKKEATDINALCDEYLRLAYHGLRAKDKTFNADFKTEFDESLPKVNIIPQDIGRVILNLINNAFYAVSERKKLNENGYEPTVVVSTKKEGDKVLISVNDNGTGISQNIADKIFQPFFTTKPTGQGTGLGLSLSYDIVKAHGGEINVERIEYENNPENHVDRGTIFIIQLPISE